MMKKLDMSFTENKIHLELIPYDKKTFNLNFDIDIIWEREDYPDLAYAEVMEG